MAFNDYLSELVSSIPRMSAPLATLLVNRAWAEIRDIRVWSFLQQAKDLYAPPIVFAGTASVTQFSPNITFDATAIAALNASQSLPPIASQSIGVGRQFRVGSVGSSQISLNNAGAVYTLLTYDPITGAATLDRPYADVTATGSQYMVYKAYFEPPVTDFVYYRSIVNVSTGYGIIRDALSVPQESLAIFDPERQSTGDAYYLSPFVTDYQNPQATPPATGTIAHEFYPHPTNPATYQCFYVRRGTALSPTQDLPQTFPSHVLVHRARMHCCDWALMNVANYTELQGTNWVLAKKEATDMFRETLILAIKQDDQFAPRMPMRVGRWYQQFPLGGQWLQSHALPPGYMQP